MQHEDCKRELIKKDKTVINFRRECIFNNYSHAGAFFVVHKDEFEVCKKCLIYSIHKGCIDKIKPSISGEDYLAIDSFNPNRP